MKFEIGDWVQGKTRQGELIHGFVESIDELQGFVKVYVVESDNEEAIGKLAAVRENRLRKLPIITVKEAGPFEVLLDIALLTRDEAWFMELSNELRSVQQNRAKNETIIIDNLSYKNRLGLSGMI